MSPCVNYPRSDRDCCARARTLANTGKHLGGTGLTHNNVLKLKPNAIIVYATGSRGLAGFQRAGVAVLKANADSVKEAVAAYKDDKLEELTEGCHEAHHG